MWPACALDSEGLALLRSAVANPLELTPRLILADWLQEQGEDEVAGIIRQSLRGRRWLPFPVGVRDRWHPWNTCYAGWPGAAPGSAEEAAILPASPWITFLALHATRATNADLSVFLPAGLSNLTHLFLSSCSGVTDVGLPALNSFASLTTLSLSGTGVTGPGLANLAALPALTELYLNDTPVADPGLVYLAGLAKLTRLDLRSAPVTDAGLPVVATLTTLTELDLSHTHVTAAGLHPLAALTNLTKLYLQGNGLTHPQVANLRRALRKCKVFIE